MSKFLYYSLLIVLFFSLLKKADGQVYNFSNYTAESGLSQSQILSVFQDEKGVMWFGTNGGGITKFDGNSYEYLTDKDGLADNLVYCITKDKAGRILIGTNNGLSVFDGKHFKNYSTKSGLTNNRIYTIFIDKKDEILLGTGKGISIFRDSVCSNFNLEEAIDNALVFNISEDSKHNLWFSTLGNGVFRYNGKVLKNYTTKDGFKYNFVYSVLEYGENVYWFFTNEGLYVLNDSPNEEHSKAIKPIYSANLSSAFTYYSYLKDKENNIWIASNRGLFKYNGKDFQWFTQKNGLVNDNIWKIFQDRENNLWFASKENGISKLESERFLMYTVKDGLINNEISRIFQSKDGRYWIGSPKGLSMYDGKIFINYNQKDRRGNDAITAITEDKEGNYLIGTGFGVQKYNGKEFFRIEHPAPSPNPLNYINDVFIDTKGESWLGTKGGVAKITDGRIKEFNKDGFPKNSVFKIYEDANGNYWFAADDGLYIYDGSVVKHFTEKDGFIGKLVYNILNDPDGNLWFATNSGLFKYNNGKFSGITEKEGLASNNIQSIAIDSKGSIFLGLSTGIDKIQFGHNKEYEIRHYEKEDGFTGQSCFFNAILIDKHDKVWIGTEKGLMVYQAQFDRKNILEPITRLKSIELFSQKTDWKLFTDSIDRNELPLHLELAHDKNYLTFNFIGVSLTTPSKVKYRFMLKGIDKKWLPETSKTEAVYTNIPPGNYEFLVIANNGEGVWNNTAVSFKFEIKPPFWQTWWFYSINAIIVLIFIYSYFKIKSANKKILKQNEIIEEKNVDLKQAYVEIADKNKSITDSINYAKRIQESFLTSENTLNKTLKNYFILYKPRDIVSGDFYWAFDLPDRVLVACADSTGHGIPGAFMSLIGISLLNEISHSKNIVEPAKMLDELRRIIICALNPEKLDSGGKDGMDIALISIFKTTETNDSSNEEQNVKIHFSGANNAMYVISGQNNQTNLMEYKSDKQPVGFYSNMKPFTQQEIIAKKGDIIFMGTDGYADQFGGIKGKKYMSKQLKKRLSSIHYLPLKEQRNILDKTFLDWKEGLDQVDDVTIIGIRI